MNKSIKNNQGFTIIEVLIVLAIAALILLTVFLAVPGLQRSQQNNARASQASRFSTEISSWIANNGGVLPGYETTGSYDKGTANTDLANIVSTFGAFNSFVGITGAGTANSLTIKQVNIANGKVTTGAVGADAMLVDTDAICGTSSTTKMITTTGTGTQVALIYTQKPSSGYYNQVCIQVQ